MALHNKISPYLPVAFKRKLKRLANSDTVRNDRSLKHFMEFINEGEILLSVPDLTGHFWIDIRSHLVRRVLVNGYYEPKVTDAIIEHLSGDFIDVGANVGFYSIHVANQTGFNGKVLSLEPNLRAFDFLSRNIELNENHGNITALQLAASSENGTIELSVVDGLEEYSTIANTRHPGVEGKNETKIRVETQTLDDIVASHNVNPGLVKIDAEGAELDVLKGMRETLNNHRPTLICEIGDSTFGTNTQAVARYFKEANYATLTLSGEEIDFLKNPISEIIARPNS